MLSVSSYADTYIDECRSKVKLQLSTYEDLVAAARNHGGRNKTLDLAIDAFEPLFYNNLLLLLDSYFCHRSRAIEGKDGNPLNEVRVLCNSMLHNGGRMSADKTIKLKPNKSILKHQVGDEIRLTGAEFLLVFEAFFAEIESKYL